MCVACVSAAQPDTSPDTCVSHRNLRGRGHSAASAGRRRALRVKPSYGSLDCPPAPSRAAPAGSSWPRMCCCIARAGVAPRAHAQPGGARACVTAQRGLVWPHAQKVRIEGQREGAAAGAPVAQRRGAGEGGWAHMCAACVSAAQPDTSPDTCVPCRYLRGRGHSAASAGVKGAASKRGRTAPSTVRLLPPALLQHGRSGRVCCCCIARAGVAPRAEAQPGGARVRGSAARSRVAACAEGAD